MIEVIMMDTVRYINSFAKNLNAHEDIKQVTIRLSSLVLMEKKTQEGVSYCVVEPKQ